MGKKLTGDEILRNQKLYDNNIKLERVFKTVDALEKQVKEHEQKIAMIEERML